MLVVRYSSKVELQGLMSVYAIHSYLLEGY
jgi:hypothetical protein